MKRYAYLLLVIGVTLISSCGVNHAILINHNQNSTQVHLSSNNYQIVNRVTGNAEIDYFFFIGGLNKSQLYENAYADMINNAELESGSKALINTVTEEHMWGIPPFYFKRTITVHAHVIEFIE